MFHAPLRQQIKSKSKLITRVLDPEKERLFHKSNVHSHLKKKDRIKRKIKNVELNSCLTFVEHEFEIHVPSSFVSCHKVVNRFHNIVNSSKVHKVS